MSITNKQISLLFKRKSFHQLLGAYRSNVKWTWLVYAQSRPYSSGDPYQRIDRRTSAKKQELYLKEFEEERMLRVVFVVHGSESMNFWSAPPTKRDCIEQLWYLLGNIVLQQGDQMGYFIHTSDTTVFSPPTRKPYCTEQFRTHIATARFTWPSTSEHVARLLSAYRLRHQLIVRVSDEIVHGPQPYFQALATSNDVLYCTILDPFEYDANPRHFSTDLVEVGNQTTKTVRIAASSNQYAVEMQKKIATSERLLASRWVTSIHASSHDDPSTIFTRLFKKHALKH